MPLSSSWMFYIPQGIQGFDDDYGGTVGFHFIDNYSTTHM